MPLTASSGSAYSPQLDILKGMAIVLVVAGHVLNRSPWPSPELRELAGWLVRWIYSFHIPLFFMLSGALFSGGRNGPLAYAARRYLRLMLPFGVYAVLYHLAFFPGQGLTVAGLGRLYLWGNLWALQTLPTSEVLWFFPALLAVNFLALMAAAPLRRLGQGWSLAGLFALQMAALGLFAAFGGRRYVPYYLDTALVCLFFFHLGRLGAAWLTRPAPAAGRPLRLAASLALLTLLACLFASRPYEALDTLRLRWWEMPLMDLSALAGASACVLLAGALATRAAPLAEGLRLLGRSSLPIFGLHILVVGAVLELGLLPLWWLRLPLTFLLALLLPWALARFLLGRWSLARWVFLGGGA